MGGVAGLKTTAACVTEGCDMIFEQLQPFSHQRRIGVGIL
jgi:hypothetical protein